VVRTERIIPRQDAIYLGKMFPIGFKRHERCIAGALVALNVVDSHSPAIATSNSPTEKNIAKNA
jgi:hypothetical protein